MGSMTRDEVAFWNLASQVKASRPFTPSDLNLDESTGFYHLTLLVVGGGQRTIAVFPDHFTESVKAGELHPSVRRDLFDALAH